MTWKRRVGTAALMAGAVVVAGITATVGWRPFIGPRARPLTNRTFEASPARLERGAYLSTSVSGCLYCHSDLDTSVPGAGVTYKPGTEGEGRWLGPEGLPFLYSPNITSHTVAGIGNLSDDALARAIREGVGHDGRALFPMMPYGNFRKMSDEDLASVIVFLRTLKPIDKPRPTPQIPFPVNRLINNAPQPLDGPVPEPDLSTPVKRGEYVTTLAGCGDCHTPRDDRNQYMAHLAFAGGQKLQLDGLRPTVFSANLTPASSGIPYYNEELFVETIRTGRVRERQLSDLMPWKYYRNMTDEDLKAIFAYLATLKPVEHYVDNAMAPTPCALCGQQHGGGQRNRPAK